MKQDFRKLWKTRHEAKVNTARDTIQFCILRAMASKEEDKLSIAKHFFHKSFVPVTNQNKLSNGAHPFNVLSVWNNSPGIRQHWQTKEYVGNILGVPATELLNEDELQEFNAIAAQLSPDKVIRRYSYFFTRQDIFKEYQLVQTAHVALELGAEIPKEQVKGLYFTCCGVKDGKELEDIEGVLKSMGLKYVVFREPDIGNLKTAIGVYPVAEHRRGLLRNYNLLKFDQES